MVLAANGGANQNHQTLPHRKATTTPRQCELLESTGSIGQAETKHVCARKPNARVEQLPGQWWVQFMMLSDDYEFYFCFVFSMFGILYFRPSYYRELQSAHLRFCKPGQRLFQEVSFQSELEPYSCRKKPKSKPSTTGPVWLRGICGHSPNTARTNLSRGYLMLPSSAPPAGIYVPHCIRCPPSTPSPSCCSHASQRQLQPSARGILLLLYPFTYLSDRCGVTVS